MEDKYRKPRNVEQLRDDIDSGRTGDKVPAADPAAAPLGADDEAAGTRTPAEAGERTTEAPRPGPVRAHSLASERGRTARVAILAGGGVLAAIVLAALFIA